MKKIIILLLIIIGGTIYYGIYISYNNLIVNKYTIEVDTVQNDVKVVVISDLHDNKIQGNNNILISKISKENPDIILVVGDIVNRYSTNSNVAIDVMKNIRKIAPTYYVLGNHDIDYINNNTSNLVKELNDIDIVVLNKEYRDLDINGESIRLGGFSDYEIELNSGIPSNQGYTDIVTYNFLSDFQNTDNYKIMMSHRPDAFIFGDNSKKWNIDLVVSGHTHGGQVILPFLGGIYVGYQGLFPKYTKGIYNIDKIKLLISSGLGSSKQILPRFNNPPEIISLNIIS